MQKGFTLIELIVAIAIIAVLYGIVTFMVAQYINNGKDANVSGNLAILIPAGEVFYSANGNSYQGVCDSNQNSVIKNAIEQIPAGTTLFCNEAQDHNSWVACAREFVNPQNAYCVDSRGMKEEIDNGSCRAGLTQCL